MKVPSAARSESTRTRHLGWGRLIDSGRPVALFAVVAVVSLGLGLILAQFVQSPSLTTTRATGGDARPITAAVEKKSLRNEITVRADASYADAVDITAGTSASGSLPIVTGTLPVVGDHIDALSVVAEVSGRPIIVLPGALPAYRTLSFGLRGDDVLQLKAALSAANIDSGDENSDLFDAATAQAVSALYGEVGYLPALSEANSEDLVRSAQDAADSAAAGLASARRALTAAKHALTSQGRLEQANLVKSAQRAESSAQRMLATAHAASLAATAAIPAATEANTATQQRSNTAQQGVSLAQNAVTAAQRAVDNATPANVPAANSALEAARDTLAARQATAAVAATDAVATQSALNSAVFDQTATQNAEADAADAVATAHDATALALAAEAAALASPNTDEEEAAVTAGTRQFSSAQAALQSAQEAALPILPVGEVAFLSQLPRRVDSVTAVLGAAAAGPLVSLSGADLGLVASVSKADAALLAVGDAATFSPADGGTPVEATVAAIDAAALPASTDGDDSGSGAEQPTTDRMAVSLVPVGLTDDQVRSLDGSNVRVSIPVGDSAENVLAVPIAAVSMGPGGASRVETIAPDGQSSMVEVTTGLVAGGDVEVTPVTGSLHVGDNVVVGR